jgi:raffinose/stachyose/melibiose transport system substrate-binding protein
MPADALGSATYRGDGQIYELPFASQTLGLFVNKDVFAKAGLTPPTDWDSFLKVCQQLKDKGIVPLANGLGTSWFNEMFVAALTNPFLGPDFVKDLTSGKATFKDPRYTAALGKLLELRPFLPHGSEGVDYDTSGQLFMSGQAAMLAGGSFDIATYRQQNPKINMDFVAPPAAKAGAPSYVTKFYDGGYAINAASPHKTEALQVLDYMGTKAFGDKLVSLLGDVSPIKGVEVKDPLLASVARLNETAMPHINVVHFRFQKPTGSELLQGDITKMMAGSITPEQVGADLTNGIAKWYTPFQGK